MILWIFPWMIGASLVLGGYLQYRHGHHLVALEDALVSVRLEAGWGVRRPTIGPSRQALRDPTLRNVGALRAVRSIDAPRGS